MSSVSLLDCANRRRSPATMSGFHQGRPPRNKGLRYPPDPPTVEEIITVMRRRRSPRRAETARRDHRAVAQSRLGEAAKPSWIQSPARTWPVVLDCRLVAHAPANGSLPLLIAR